MLQFIFPTWRFLDNNIKPRHTHPPGDVVEHLLKNHFQCAYTWLNKFVSDRYVHIDVPFCGTFLARERVHVWCRGWRVSLAGVLLAACRVCSACWVREESLGGTWPSDLFLSCHSVVLSLCHNLFGFIPSFSCHLPFLYIFIYFSLSPFLLFSLVLFSWSLFSLFSPSFLILLPLARVT